MTDQETPERTGITRREALQLSGLALGGLALGGTASADNMCAYSTNSCIGPTYPDTKDSTWTNVNKSQRYQYFDKLPKFYPFRQKRANVQNDSTIPLLDQDSIRITFMGSAIPPRTLPQHMMSVFVEVGWDAKLNQPADQFVFDCGSGVCSNYNAMNVGFGRMDKIFITHLHGDHMGDLAHIYCFGPSQDRKSPLFIWGQGSSNVPNPLWKKGSQTQPPSYDDGLNTFCRHFREACRWHSESFSFQTTAYQEYKPNKQTAWGLPCEPAPAGDWPDDPSDGFALRPIELAFDWAHPTAVVAYNNASTGVKITAFPVIHDRQGSIGYKLEFKRPGSNAPTLSMIYTGDTKPEHLSLDHAANADGSTVDVFIHEMVPPANVWAMKMFRATNPNPPATPQSAIDNAKMVQNSSHTPQGAFGYLLSQLNPRPRLTVAAHFPTEDDTVESAMRSLQAHCTVYQGENPRPPKGAARVTWAFDRLVITVSKDRVIEQQGVVDQFGFNADIKLPQGVHYKTPKYNDGHGNGDPYAQINTVTAICPCNANGTCNYKADGY